MADIREMVMEFEKQRQSLLNISMQKQQLQASVNGITKTLEELDNSKEEKVYKAIGNIMILREKKEVKIELEELKETQSLHMKTMEKQEKSLVEKLNTLKTQIESTAGASVPAPKEGDATVISSKKNAE